MDPEQLLAALERGESAAQGCDREPRPERSSRRRMVSGVDLLELAETAPENEQDAAPPAPSAAPSAPSLAPPAPVLRDNETALTTSSGILVIRRRRAA